MYFQDIIFTLQKFWHENKCVILQPYDMEVGAGTSHPATTLKALDKNPWNTAYVQPCRRPADGRYGDNPNRTQHYYQFQVLLKPSPDNIQQLCIDSLEKLGINCKENDIRFIEDDWENPTLGAWGLGWEIWCNGMEVIQFTYMQQVGGIDCKMISGEITYGLERLAMYIQDKDSFWDLKWNSQGLTYKDIFLDSEKEYCAFNFEYADTKKLISYFADCEESVDNLIEKNLIRPAYDYCLKASHTFNLLDSRGVLSVAERVHFISKVRDMTKKCCKKWTEFY